MSYCNGDSFFLQETKALKLEQEKKKKEEKLKEAIAEAEKAAKANEQAKQNQQALQSQQALQNQQAMQENTIISTVSSISDVPGVSETLKHEQQMNEMIVVSKSGAHHTQQSQIISGMDGTTYTLGSLVSENVSTSNLVGSIVSNNASGLVTVRGQPDHTHTQHITVQVRFLTFRQI